MVAAARPRASSCVRVTSHHDAVERQARFGTIPGDELFDCILVGPARSERGQAVETADLEYCAKGTGACMPFALPAGQAAG